MFEEIKINRFYKSQRILYKFLTLCYIVVCSEINNANAILQTRK